MTTLHRNAFALLGASTRDTRAQIVELADTKALEEDQAIVQKARADLTTPRARLAVEVAWLPGVSPKRAAQLLMDLKQSPAGARRATGLPPLADANLLAASFEGRVDEKVEDAATAVLRLASLFESLDPEAILRDINEDRAIAELPLVSNAGSIAEILNDRRRYYRDVIESSFDQLDPHKLVAVTTRIAEEATQNGTVHAPSLVDDLIDSYALKCEDFLDKEAQNVRGVLKAVRDGADSFGETALRPLLERLKALVYNWDHVAQPIQLSAKARGIQHDASRDLAIEIRSVAVDLCNQHDFLESARVITELLQEVFEEVPEVFERLQEDAAALDNIVATRVQAERDAAEFAQNITFEADVGLMFKDKLRISPAGIEWKNDKRPLGSITRVRWGGLRRSINGIPTGTYYTIAVGDSRSECVIELNRQATYAGFVERLWPAVCGRLCFEHVQALKNGQALHFGSATLRDGGVDLIRRRFLKSDERVPCSWHDVSIWTSDGSFFIGKKEDNKTYVQLSYIEVPNVHIIEHLIRQFFKTGKSKLSEAFG